MMTFQPFKFAFVLCLVLGLAGMLLPAGAAETETQIKIPVVIQNLPPGKMVTGPPFQGIEIQVRGPAARLSSLADLKLQYILDLSAMEAGIHTVPVRVDRLNLPQGLSVVSLHPPSLQVHLETETRKEVAVVVFFKGTPAPGFFVAKTATDPQKVVLRGPKRVLDTIENVSTLPIDVSDASESFRKEISLNLVADLEMLTPKTPIFADITLSEEILTKRFSNIKVLGNDPQHAFEITPPVITIDVKGPAKLLENLASSPEFKVYLDIKGLAPGVYVRRASLELPVGTTLISAAPEIFTIRITE